MKIPSYFGTAVTGAHRFPSLLRYLADLLTTHFAAAADLASTRLRQFANLHEAPDLEVYLQRIDPDLATAMRRILNLPEPKDTVAKCGRKRAR
jgi:hypothetical protein